MIILLFIAPLSTDFLHRLILLVRCSSTTIPTASLLLSEASPSNLSPGKTSKALLLPNHPTLPIFTGISTISLEVMAKDVSQTWQLMSTYVRKAGESKNKSNYCNISTDTIWSAAYVLYLSSKKLTTIW